MRRGFVLLGSVWLLVGCADDPVPAADAAVPRLDASILDVGDAAVARDAGASDADRPDRGLADAGSSDSGMGDAGHPADIGADGGRSDIGGLDVGGSDTGVPAPVTLLVDELDDPAPWTVTADPGRVAGSMDAATATVTGGQLIIDASQDFGCPVAQARRAVGRAMLPSGSTGLEVVVVLAELDRSVQGSVSLTVVVGERRVQLHFRDLAMLTGRATTIRVRGGSSPAATIDGQPLDAIEYTVDSQPGLQSEVHLRVRACAADAYAGARIVLERLTISAVP